MESFPRFMVVKPLSIAVSSLFLVSVKKMLAVTILSINELFFWLCFILYEYLEGGKKKEGVKNPKPPRIFLEGVIPDQKCFFKDV